MGDSDGFFSSGRVIHENLNILEPGNYQKLESYVTEF